MKNKIMNLAVAMLSVAFLQTGCSEEDFPQPQQSGAAGTLHIASISIDGQQVKSRAVADDGKQYDFNKYAYNQSLNSFAEDGDELVVEYSFGVVNPQVAFINYKDGNWNFTEASVSETEVINTGNPITIVPGEGVDWDDLYFMAIGSNVGIVLEGDKEPYADVATELGIVQGNFDKENIRLAADWLYAYSEDGSLTVDTDIKSPTLGAVSATLKHGFRSLLRLPESAISIDTRNPYLVGGQNYSVTGLATLWAVMTNEGGTGTTYFPLTQVDSNLQSIISLQDCPYLTGFKAVLYTTESGQPGDAGYDATKVLTLDLPLKAGTETRIRLEENYMYPLTLSISPNSSSVTLSGDGLGKPGWGEDEDENTLSNGLNEAKNELSYTGGSDNNAGTFSVSGPNGLMLLNMWMTGAISIEVFKSVAFEGANNITDDVNPLAQNITFTADITLPAPKDGKSNWTRLGNADKPYTGTIDGGNYTLTGLLIRGYANFQGFVGCLGKGGKVKNLTFKDAKVLAFYDCVGIVAGKNMGIVENCHTTGNSLINIFEGTFDDVICYVGGIVGFNDGMISACINNAEINADGVTRIGGVVGLSSLNDVVIACGNTAMVNDENYSGGIVGENSGTVTASWTQTTNEKNDLGEKPTEERKNGVGDETNESIITACHVFSEASAVTAEHITTMNIAIAAWNATDGNTAVEYGWKATTSGQWPSLALITELSDSWPIKVEDLYKVDTELYTADGVKVESHGVLFTDGTDYYTAAGKKLESHGVLFTDGTDYYTSAGEKVDGFALKAGTATVSTADGLLLWNALAQTDLDLNLTLETDITLPAPKDGESNWTPVGKDGLYTGTIDGAGHTLTGMVINSTDRNQGFVGCLGVGGKVQNLTFNDAQVTGGNKTAIVVGQMLNSTVENCHTTATSSMKDAIMESGGLVGYNTNGIITRCSNAAQVEGVGGIGGIVGTNLGIVSACINSGAVSAFDAGGIVGYNIQGLVIACGNTGTINGTYNLGGIVGRHDGGNVIASWTQDTNEKDNDGNAPSTSPENGVGGENGGSIKACYVFSQASYITTMNIAIAAWNATDGNTAIAYGWKAATTNGQWPSLALITELSDSWPVKVEDLYMVDTELYTADGVKVESLADFYTDGTDYYTSAGEKVEGFELANGTATVSTANALLLWNAMAQTDPTLNLTFTDNITLPEPAEGGSNWTPVGNSETPYTGKIDGGGKTLTGMVINSTEHDQGFVGCLDEGGKVQNITFANATVISSFAFSIGIVVSYNKGTVENCHTTGTVKGESSPIGGIVGENVSNAIITNCTNAATMEGEDVSAGGIAGINRGLVSACINSGELSVTFTENGDIHLPDSPNDYSGVGGIVGDNDGDVIACGNTDAVDGTYNSGGIVGKHYGGNVIASWTQDTNEKDNDGKAPSSTENGVGGENGGSIKACYVFGSPSAVAVESITAMNAAIVDYNNDTASVKCLYSWSWESGTSGYPTLKTVTE